MENDSQSTYVNMSVYVALSCLLAFAIVITICLVKQFIWDPLLSQRFEVLRPVLSESVRKLSTSFYRTQSTCSMPKSTSDSCVRSSEPPVPSLPNNNNKSNFITVPQNLLSTDNPLSPSNKFLPRRSYGSSSLNVFAYTNHGSDDLADEKCNPCPLLHFSCEYNPLTFSIRLNVQNLRNMNGLLTTFGHLLKSNAFIFVRFMLATTVTGEPYETSLQPFQDFIRVGETFNILSNIRSGDVLTYQIKFSLMLLTDKNMYELGEVTYSMKDDQLTHILFLERILPVHLAKKLKSATSDDSD